MSPRRANTRPLPPVERLRDAFNYDPETGVLTWARAGRRRTVGGIAGSLKPNGYWAVGFEGHDYLVHRIAWAMTYGVDPGDDIDHRNLARGDNRIINLRTATAGQNAANHALSKSNTTGFKGVTYQARKRKWRAYIKVAGKGKIIGYYATAEAAARAWDAEALRVHGQFAPSCAITTTTTRTILGERHHEPPPYPRRRTR